MQFGLNTACHRNHLTRDRQKESQLQTANSHPPGIGKFGLKLPIHGLIMEVFCGMGSIINGISKSDILYRRNTL